MLANSRQRWAYINRDKDLDKKPLIENSKRINPKRKSKAKGTKTRDKVDPDYKDTIKDKDLK